MSEKDGGPAFPEMAYRMVDSEFKLSGAGQVPQAYLQSGMSLRDWFAGQALSGVIAKLGTGDYLLCANHAYAAADQLLKERGK